MRHIFSLMFLFVTTFSVAQQINPVPDYIFRNQMSVGRNAATDTAAYLSIGPRFGAIKGFQPPMVVDTASFSGSKRNGLTIFSVQKNKYVYWDSVGVKWAEMSGTGGSAITGSGTANYLTIFTTTTNLANSGVYQTPGGKIVIGSTTDTTKLFNVNGESKTGTLTVNSNGQKITIETYKPAGRGNNIFIGKADTLNASGAIAGGSNIALGYEALQSLTDGYDNVAIGSQVLEDLTTGYQNMGIGTFALANVTSGFANVGVGAGALTTLTTGYYNTAIGKDALNAVSTGLQNIGIGYIAGRKITTGNKNLSIGAEALSELTTGSSNLAFGFAALQNTTTASSNVAIGEYALFTNVTGTRNASIGLTSLYTSTGSDNVGVGHETLKNNGASDKNTAIGSLAGGLNAISGGSNTLAGYAAAYTLTSGYENALFGGRVMQGLNGGYRNAALGYEAGRYITAGTDNQSSNTSVYIGYDTRASANGNTNEIVIGSEARGNGSNTVTIGNGSITDNYFTGALRTSAPTGGTAAAWRLGTVATVTPTSPNRTIEVSIGGTIYYIHAKTTND